MWTAIRRDPYQKIRGFDVQVQNTQSMRRSQRLSGLRHELDLEVERNRRATSRSGAPIRQAAFGVVLHFQKIRESLEVVVQQPHDVVAFAQAAPQNAVNGEFALEDTNLLRLQSKLEYSSLIALVMAREPQLTALVERPQQAPARAQSWCI